MAARWLAAARRLPIAPVTAAALGLAVVTSCLLPSYSVGDATSSGTAGSATSSGSAAGAGAGATVGSSTASVGPGGAGIGGSGIGGEIMCGDDADSRTVIAPSETTPHGIALSANYVYWIADDDDAVHFAARGMQHMPTKLGLSGVCGLAAGAINGKEQVVMRKRDGSIYVSTSPFDKVERKVLPGGGPLDTEGLCAISEDPMADYVYGFEVENGVSNVMLYQLSKKSRNMVVAAQGAPVAIDASADNYVAWVAALNGTGYFVATKKVTPADPMVMSGSPPFPDVCAYGHTDKFAYIAPGASAIDTWWPNGGGFLTTNVHATRIACSQQHHVWIEYGNGCATLKSLDVAGGTPVTIATNQARACSIALGGGDVYWTTCETTGGVYKRTLGP